MTAIINEGNYICCSIQFRQDGLATGDYFKIALCDNLDTPIAMISELANYQDVFQEIRIGKKEIISTDGSTCAYDLDKLPDEIIEYFGKSRNEFDGKIKGLESFILEYLRENKND